MATWIDRGGQITYTEAQISKHMQRLERLAFSEREEAILNRIQHGVTIGAYTPTPDEQNKLLAFQATMNGLMALAAEAREDNQFVQQRLAYEQAVARLTRYPLADGRAAVYEERPTGAYDEQGDPVMELVLAAAAIDPLPAEVEAPVLDPETGEQTGTEMIPNPLIAADVAEREQAQAVIDATPQAVIDFTEGAQ